LEWLCGPISRFPTDPMRFSRSNTSSTKNILPLKRNSVIGSLSFPQSSPFLVFHFPTAFPSASATRPPRYHSPTLNATLKTTNEITKLFIFTFFLLFSKISLTHCRIKTKSRGWRVSRRISERNQVKFVMELSNREIARYSRQIILPGVGMKGQKSLKASSVLVVGAGGLGCPVSSNLAGAGIGELSVQQLERLLTEDFSRNDRNR
jgi:hypothetical protein